MCSNRKTAAPARILTSTPRLPRQIHRSSMALAFLTLIDAVAVDFRPSTRPSGRFFNPTTRKRMTASHPTEATGDPRGGNDSSGHQHPKSAVGRSDRFGVRAMRSREPRSPIWAPTLLWECPPICLHDLRVFAGAFSVRVRALDRNGALCHHRRYPLRARPNRRQVETVPKRHDARR